MAVPAVRKGFLTARGDSDKDPVIPSKAGIHNGSESHIESSGARFGGSGQARFASSAQGSLLTYPATRFDLLGFLAVWSAAAMLPP